MNADCRLAAEEVQTLLAEFFGGSFRVHHLATSGDCPAGNAELPGRSQQPVSSAVELLPSDVVRITVHLGAIIGSDTFVTGECRRSAAEMLNALPSMAAKYLAAQAKISELNRCLESCSRYVSQHLEELTWLRSLAQHVALCRDEQELEEAASQLLPALVGLVGAKQIVLVRNSTEGAAAREVVRRCGEICLTDAKCIRLIEQLLAEGGEGVVVKNDFAPLDEFGEQSRPRSCILAPIQTPRSLVGWLLALDKDEDGDPMMPRPSVQEFGTVEASLLATAAQMLAAHQRDRALLASH